MDTSFFKVKSSKIPMLYTQQSRMMLAVHHTNERQVIKAKISFTRARIT